MPAITQTISPDLLSMYSGYDQNRQEVGAGLVNPNIYSTPDYRDKKISSVVIGGISDIIYSAADHDPTPRLLAIAFEPAYQTVIGINLRYVPTKTRQNIMKFVLDSNVARIKANQPMMIDWHSLSRAVPEVKYITRRYKVVLIGVRETYPIVEWPEIVNESSPYQNHYKQVQ